MSYVEKGKRFAVENGWVAGIIFACLTITLSSIVTMTWPKDRETKESYATNSVLFLAMIALVGLLAYRRRRLPLEDISSGKDENGENGKLKGSVSKGFGLTFSVLLFFFFVACLAIIVSEAVYPRAGMNPRTLMVPGLYAFFSFSLFMLNTLFFSRDWKKAMEEDSQVPKNRTMMAVMSGFFLFLGVITVAVSYNRSLQAEKRMKKDQKAGETSARKKKSRKPDPLAKPGVNFKSDTSEDLKFLGWVNDSSLPRDLLENDAALLGIKEIQNLLFPGKTGDRNNSDMFGPDVWTQGNYGSVSYRGYPTTNCSLSLEKTRAMVPDRFRWLYEIKIQHQAPPGSTPDIKRQIAVVSASVMVPLREAVVNQLFMICPEGVSLSYTRYRDQTDKMGILTAQSTKWPQTPRWLENENAKTIAAEQLEQCVRVLFAALAFANDYLYEEYANANPAPTPLAMKKIADFTYEINDNPKIPIFCLYRGDEILNNGGLSNVGAGTSLGLISKVTYVSMQNYKIDLDRANENIKILYDRNNLIINTPFGFKRTRRTSTIASFKTMAEESVPAVGFEFLLKKLWILEGVEKVDISEC